MIVLAIIFAIVVTPSRVCGLKLFEEVYAAGHDNVTPSRVCGLKRVGRMSHNGVVGSHPHGCVD